MTENPNEGTEIPEQAAGLPGGNVAITLLDELPGAPAGRRFGFATGDMPLPPGGLAYVIEIVGDPDALPGVPEAAPDSEGAQDLAASAQDEVQTPVSDAAVPDFPSPVTAPAPTDGEGGSSDPSDVEPPSLRIIGYVDRFSRAFVVDGALSMPPARRADVQLLRYADRDDGVGCVELPGFDPDDEPWRVAEFRATSEGRVLYTDSRVDLGLVPGGPSLTLAHAVSLAFLAFVYLPQQRGEDLATLGVPDVLDRLRTEELFDAIDHIVSDVDEVAGQQLVAPLGILLYLVRMLRGAGAVGLTPAALAPRSDSASGLAAGGELSWVSAGAVAPSPLIPGLFLAASGPAGPQVHLVRTTEYANLFYIAFNRSQVSDEGARTLLELEGILNRFLLIARRLDEVGAVMTATEGQCAELDRWVVEDILAQGLATLRDQGLLAGESTTGDDLSGGLSDGLSDDGAASPVSPAEDESPDESLAPAASTSVPADESPAAPVFDGKLSAEASVSDGAVGESGISAGVAAAGGTPLASASGPVADSESPIIAASTGEPSASPEPGGSSEASAEGVPALAAPVPSAEASERVANDYPALPLTGFGFDDLPLFEAPSVPKPAPDRGDIDVRLAFARACESLQLPYRLEYRFRYDAERGALSMDIDRPGTAIMPRDLWDRAAGAWRPLSLAERGADATRYAFHLAILVACAAFACDRRVRRLIVNVWGAALGSAESVAPAAIPEPAASVASGAVAPTVPASAASQPAGAPAASEPADAPDTAGPEPTVPSASEPTEPEAGAASQPTGVSDVSGSAEAPDDAASEPIEPADPAASEPSSTPAVPAGVPAVSAAPLDGLFDLSALKAALLAEVPSDTPTADCLLSVGFNRATFLAALRAAEPTVPEASEPSAAVVDPSASAATGPAAPEGALTSSDAHTPDPSDAPAPASAYSFSGASASASADVPAASADAAPARSAAELDPSALIRRFAHAFRLGADATPLPVHALTSLDASTALPSGARRDIETDERPFSAKAARLLRARRVRDLGIYEDAPRRRLADTARSAFAFDDLPETLATIRDMYSRTENVPVREACLRVSEGIAAGTITEDSTDELKEIFSDVYGLKAGLRSATRLAQRDPMAAVAALESLELQVEERGWFTDTPTRVYRYFDCYAARVLYATHCAASLDDGRDLRLCADENFLIHHRLATLLSDSIEHGEEAIRHGRRCVELAPSVAASYLRLARCYFCAFDYQSEINALNRMLTIAWNPVDVGMALYWLGYAYWMTDRKRLGLACYQRSVLYDRNLAEPCTAEVTEFLRKEGMRPEIIDDEEARELFREGGVPLGQVRLNAEALVRAAGYAADAGSYRLAQNLLGSASVILRDDALAPVLESYGSDAD